MIMLDVTVTIVIKGVGLLDDPESAKTSALAEIEAQLKEGLRTFSGATLTTAALKQMLALSDVELAARLEEYKRSLTVGVEERARKLQERLAREAW